MELAPHSLVRIRGVVDLIGQPFPHWVSDALAYAPFVVIRRTQKKEGMVGVGIRGAARWQRCAAWLEEGKWSEVITPFMLADQLNWRMNYRAYAPVVIRTLQLITPVMEQTGYQWGPTGSCGFELASGRPTLNKDSDLDLIIDLPGAPHKERLKNLLSELERLALARIDIQLNTPSGSVALTEYINSEIVLIKTLNGPVLQRGHQLW